MRGTYKKIDENGLLLCTRKQHYLPRDQFYDKTYVRKDGTRSPLSWCKGCMCEYRRDRHVAKKSAGSVQPAV
jgi:hypothetical protein